MAQSTAEQIPVVDPEPRPRASRRPIQGSEKHQPQSPRAEVTEGRQCAQGAIVSPGDCPGWRVNFENGSTVTIYLGSLPGTPLDELTATGFRGDAAVLVDDLAPADRHRRPTGHVATRIGRITRLR